MKPNPYAVLSLPPDASEAEIQKAWAAALKQARRGGTRSIEEINDARTALLDPERRAQALVEGFPDGLAAGVKGAPEAPDDLSLGWLEATFRWKWHSGDELLASLQPRAELPTRADLIALFPSYEPQLPMEAAAANLTQYASAVDDPWPQDGGAATSWDARVETATQAKTKSWVSASMK